jgi:hypothetical protein
MRKKSLGSYTNRLHGLWERNTGTHTMHLNLLSRKYFIALHCTIFSDSTGYREPDAVFSSLEALIPPAVYSLLTKTIARRLTPQPIKLRADIELTCYTPSGIDAIKKALRAGEKQSSEAVPIKAKLVAPPLYVLSTNATDKASSF